MDKFPGDVETAEKLTGGDPDILSQGKFCPEEKPDISALFGEKKIPKKKRDREDGHRRSDGADMRKITHPRFLRGESEHEVRIRQQPSSLPSTPTNTGSPVYRCHFCNFTSSRINVIICHIKCHRSGDPSTPRSRVKTYSQSRSGISDMSTPKRKYVKKDKSQSSKKKSESGLESGKRRHSKQNEKSSKKKKTDPELREKLLADWEDESDEETINNVNNSLKNSSSPVKNQSGTDDKEYNDESIAENNEILAETEKLLKDTEGLSSIQMIQQLSNFDKKSESETDVKVSSVSNETFNKSPKKDTSSSDSESKNVSDKDDKKSRLSCFDFDEDDLSEPSIPPVRKIPRVFGEKNLSLKKEIIKEFAMSQALKNEIKKEAEISELGRNMELKADEIMEIIQGNDNQQEKKETKMNKKLDENVQNEIEMRQSEDKGKKTIQSKNDQQKSNINTSEAKMEIVEIVEEREKSNEHSSNVTKHSEKKSKVTTPDVSTKSDETLSDMKDNNDKLLQSEKADSEDAIAESNDNTSIKEADDTLSERFTTETEDETVSESAETMPEQSENSDTDLLDQSVDNGLSGIGQTLIKRGRGRPRKNTRTINKSANIDKSPKIKTNRGSKRFRLSEKIEIERKTSDSDTDRSYSGRRRKPNKKYLESDIYVQDPDYKAFKTDESQSESETKVSERIISKSRRGRRSRGADKKSSGFVTQRDKEEIEVSDQTPAVIENSSVSSIDMKYEVFDNRIFKKETLSEEGKSEEAKCDVLEERIKAALDEAAVAKIDMNVSSEDVEMTTETTSKMEEIELDVGKSVKESSEEKEKTNLIKINKDIEKNLKDQKKPSIIEQTEDTMDKVETQQDVSKTSMDMLPPKKSQMKKFESSQIDLFDTDVQANKTVGAELESECKIEFESKIEIEPDHQFESQNNAKEKVNEEDEIVIKRTVSKITDEIAKILDTKKEEQENLKNFELQEKLNKSDEKEQETQSMEEEVLQKSQDVNQFELQSLEKSSAASKPDDAGNTSNSPTKIITEQQLTPKKSPMETRYKGKFTPETGKGKKDKDLFLEERPANTFQEAFLKTLQMDKKKIMIEDESPKGKKEKKITKKKAEEVKVNITAIPIQSTKIEDSNKVLGIPENISIEGNVSDVSVVSNFENIEVVIEEKIEIDNKIKDSSFETTDTRLGSSPNEFIITSKSSVSENNTKNISNVKKLGEISKTSVSTSSISSDISVPVKKREMPRIIENVTLTEPVQILKPNKLSQKGVKHKLEMDVMKKSDQKGGPKAKIMKIETLPSNSKLKTIKSNLTSPHMSLTKKLQVLKTEETDAFLEAQNKEQSSTPTTQTIVTVPVTEKYIQQSSQSLVDMELDINSMPFVLSEDVLMPENIEQMPVVISSIIPSSSIPATLSFTPTTQIISPTKQTQFKITNETTAAETSPIKKKSGMPAILKKESKAKPTITSVKTLVPPLTGGVKGLKFQSAQPTSKTPSLLTQKGKYVVVQTAGTQQLRYSVQGKSDTQQKIIPTTSKPAGNAQVIQQGNKVVILTSGQSKMVPLNISKTLSGKMQRIVTSKGQLLCPISPQSIITSKIIAPKADTAAAAGSPTTSKLATGSHKIINTQGIITSKGVLTPISGTIGKTALLGTLPQGILTKGGIYTPISASSLSGKTIISSKALITKGGATLLSPQTQNLGGSKAILTPVSQTLTGKTILNPQAIVSSKGTILTPITGQQVKAIAAKSPVKGGKVQYQPVQQKVQLPILQKSSKVPISAAGSQAKSSGKSPGSTLILPNATGTGTQKSTSHSKKSIKQQAVVQPGTTTINIASPSGAQQTVTMVTQKVQPKSKTVQKVVLPKTGRQTKTQQKFIVQKVQEPAVSMMQSIHAKQTITTTTSANMPIATKTVAQSKQTTPVTPLKSSTKSHASSKAQKNMLNIAMNSISTVTTNANIVTTMALPPLEPIDAEKKTKTDLQFTDISQKEQNKIEKFQIEKSSGDTEKTEEPKVATQPQIMALPTESSDGTQTYVLVTIDEQGQIQPLDNNALMSLEGTTQNPDGTRTLYIDPSSLGEAGTLDNIVLQFDNGVLPNIQTNVTEANQTTIITESFPTSEMIQTSNQDILAAALANTDFQQEINLPENQASGSVMTQTGLTQTSLINQTILQSTIIPPTEPISSPSVLETSLTLNQPIMTPLEVPSNLPIQSTDSTPTSVVSTIPSSLELPITITNPSISYISATGEPQIQIPGNSMPDIGEIIEGPATAASSGDIDRAKIPVSTQYLVIPNLENNITAETQNVQSAEIAITPSVSYTVTMPSSIVLENPQVQTTPSMPIIDDTYADNSQFATTIVAEQIVDVPVSKMLICKTPTIQHMPLEDIEETSEMIISTHQISAFPQKSITSSDKSKSLDKEQTATMQEVYSSQEVPITAEELILQQPAKEDSVSSAMKLDREKKGDNKESDAPMTSLPIIDETTSITSESNSKIESIEQVSFEVTDSSELKAAESHEADAVDKLKQLTFSEGSRDKTNLIDQQVAGTSNQVETRATSQILPAELLNTPSDATMEMDEAVESELYAGSTSDKRDVKDNQKDEPSSQEESDRRRLRQSMELHFEEEEEVAIAEINQETPSQSQYEQFNVSISSDSADLPSQSAGKLESSLGEATQSIAYESMETDEETIVAEPPTQSFEHSKINEASQSYEVSAEANINAPTQSFNEIQNQVERPSADEAIDDQSFPTQSYEIDKGENMAENMETDAEISQEGNIPSQSNDVGADGIGTSSVSTNNSGLNEDETASSSYVPETPENQERDQDQESAISTSSYEIPPCEELNIASSSVIPDTSVSAEHTGIHDNGVPEIPTSSSYNLNPDITSTHHVDSVPSSSYEDQVIVEQNVSTSYEVPISMPGLEETCSQNFVTESSDHHRNEPSSYYAHHQEVTASYYESVDQDANSRLEEDPHEEHVTPGGYYEGNPQEVSQSYFAPTEEETPNYTSHSISSGYYDPSRPESEASQSYYSTDDLDGKTEQSSSSSPNIEASQSFYQERSGELRLRQQGEATPTYSEGYPVDYTLENSPIERHDLVESSVPATRPMDR